MQQETASTFLTVAAEVMSKDGEDKLRVVALTNFIGDGKEGWPATMSFKTTIAPF